LIGIKAAQMEEEGAHALEMGKEEAQAAQTTY